MLHKTSFHLSSLLRNCVAFSAISQAKQIHGQILIRGFVRSVTLQTDLLLVYCKCGVFQDARQVFDKMAERNMHSWNIMIASYAQNSLNSDGLDVFYEFRKAGFQLDHYTFPPVFKICVGMGDAYLGEILHGLVIRLGFEECVFVGNSVLDFYVKCGNLAGARQVFDGLLWRDSVVWNSMISGLGRAGLYGDALNCFREMLGKGIKIDCMIIPSILNVCRGDGHLMKGKEIHAQVVKRLLFNKDIAIGNSLIDMYAKCGCLIDSENVFRFMPELNLITWTTMISSYGVHGKGEESMILFKRIRDWGLKPNCVTLTAVLASCSHSGLIDQGWKVFESINSEFGFEPSVEHYACMVDLLGRCGYLEEAFELVKNMKLVVTAGVWGALLAGCVMHKNVKIGEIGARHLFELEPRNSSNYIALCSIYDSLGMSSYLSAMRVKMRQLDLVKTPGCSWVTISGTIHKFYQGDRSHPATQMIYETLNSIKAPAILDD